MLPVMGSRVMMVPLLTALIVVLLLNSTPTSATPVVVPGASPSPATSPNDPSEVRKEQAREMFQKVKEATPKALNVLWAPQRMVLGAIKEPFKWYGLLSEPDKAKPLDHAKDHARQAQSGNAFPLEPQIRGMLDRLSSTEEYTRTLCVSGTNKNVCKERCKDSNDDTEENFQCALQKCNPTLLPGRRPKGCPRGHISYSFTRKEFTNNPIRHLGVYPRQNP